jgi:hypothetical protein
MGTVGDQLARLHIQQAVLERDNGAVMADVAVDPRGLIDAQ